MSLEMRNWSGTAVVTVSGHHEPRDESELSEVIRAAAESGRKVRFVGSNMSPNGVALADGVVAVSTRRFDRVLEVSKGEKKESGGWVRTQSGVRVEDLLDRLEEKGLTLVAFPATTGMTVGGLIQAGCHGTGASSPPLDELATAVRFVAADGRVHQLSEEEDGAEFLAARCSLGTFGAVTEVKLRATPLYYLREELQVMTRKELREGHAERLRNCRHLKHHFLPYTDKVVVYMHEEIPKQEYEMEKAKGEEKKFSERKLKHKLLELNYWLGPSEEASFERFAEENEYKSFAELRETALKWAPLDASHVAAVNRAELDFWEKSQGRRVGTGRELLMFECGGSQLVKEVVYRVDRDCKDLDFVEDVLQVVEERRIAAPSPIEQRWSAPSRSHLSPAHCGGGGGGGGGEEAAVFSWTNIIMYMTGEEEIDGKIRRAMGHYFEAVLEGLDDRYRLDEHLAKTEATDRAGGAVMARRARCAGRRAEFHRIRRRYDPADVFLTEHAALATSEPTAL